MRCCVALCSLLFLLGVVAGWPGGVEYQFRYSSRLVTGLPSLKQQYAATGIEADVIMQVTQQGTIVLQLSNVVTGVLHDEMHCDPSAPVPIQYQPLSDEYINLPFNVHINGSRAVHLETGSEPTWVTNTKKAVANIINIPPLLGHMSKLPSFKHEEETMAGTCDVWYSLVKMQEYQTILENQRQSIEVDAQASAQGASYTSSKTGGSKTSSKTRGSKTRGSKTHGSKTPQGSGSLTAPEVAPINPDLWMLTRGVQYKTCHGGFHMAFHGNKEAEESIKQTTTSEYLLRGEVGAFRVERAVVTGTVTVFPHAHDYNHFITAITNQTLELVSVRSLENENPVVQYHNNHKFYFSPDYLPDQEPGRRPSLAEALTGVPMSEQTITAAQAMLVEYITILAQSPFNTNARDSLVSYASKAIDILSDFTQAEIAMVQSRLPNDNPTQHKAMTKILNNLVASVGTDEAISYVIQQLNNADAFEDINYLGLFMQIIDSVRNPAIIPQLINLVMHPHGGISHVENNVARLTVAKLIDDLCISPNKHTTNTYTACDTHHTCEIQQVFDTFIPALKNDFQLQVAQETNIYHPDIILQALCYLGTPSEIPFFKDIILGNNGHAESMRMHALYCLNAYYMPAHARTTILSFLLPLVHNVGEAPEVRSVAFLVATTWKPDLSWWHRMALSTWHEPSSQVASFITATITSLARSSGSLSEIAGRSAYLAKPSAPASLMHSSYVYLQEVVHRCEGSMDVSIAWLLSTKSSDAAHIFVRLFNSVPDFGERDLLLMKVFRRFPKIPDDMFPFNMDSEDARLVWEEFTALMESLEVSVGQGRVLPRTNAVVDINHLKDIVNAEFAGLLNFPRRTFVSVMNGLNVFFLTISRFRATTFALPTDLGIPLVVKYTKDSIRKLVMENSNDVSFAGQLQRTLEVRSLLPTEGGAAAAAGITNTLDALIQITTSNTRDPITGSMVLEVTPVTHSETELLHLHNAPYTSLTGLYPTQTIPQSWTQREIHTIDIPTEGEVSAAAALGFSLHYIWHGDLPFPPPVMEVLWEPFSFHNWDFRLTLRPQHSTTTKIQLSPIFSHRTARVRQTEIVEVENLGQVSQGAADYDYMGQVSQSSSSDYQEFGQVSGFDQQIGGSVQEPDRFGRLQQEVEPVHGGWVGTIGFDLVLLDNDGRESKYETAATWSRSLDHRTTRLILSLTSFPPQGTLGEPKAVCLDLSAERPPFPPRRHPLQPEDLRTSAGFNIQYGPSCNSGPPVAKVEATLDVTAEALAKVLEERSEECGHQHTNDMEIFASPVYDDINIHAMWTQELPQHLRNLTYYLSQYLNICLNPAASPEGNIRVHGTRSLSTGLWNIVKEMPNEISQVENQEEPFWFSALVVPADLYSLYTYRYLHGEDDPTCHISETQIRTYDGRKYAFEPTNCWTSAVFRYTATGDTPTPLHEDISVQFRFTEEWEIRILNMNKGLYIEGSSQAIMVNGEIVNESRHGKFDYKRTDNGITIAIPNVITVTITDTISIRVSDEYYAVQRGMCGIYDGDPTNDLTGPLGCLYSDPELFKHAWSTSAQGCNRFTLRANRRKVTEYQEVCPRQVYQATGTTQPNATISCLEWNYEEITNDDFHCTSLTQVPHCKTECVPAITVNEKIKYKCKSTWPSQDDTQCLTMARTIPVTLACTPS